MDDSPAAPGTEPCKENAEAAARESELLAGSRTGEERYRARLRRKRALNCAAVTTFCEFFITGQSDMCVRSGSFGSVVETNVLPIPCGAMRPPEKRSPRFVSIWVPGIATWKSSWLYISVSLGHSDFVIDCLEVNPSCWNAAAVRP